MTNDKLIAALKRLASDRHDCRECELRNECGPMRCKVAEMAAVRLEAAYAQKNI